MSKTFAARWAYTCACCGVEQLEGTLSAYNDQGLLISVEVDHTPGDEGYQIDAGGREFQGRMPDVMPRGKTAADRCDRCFMIHATGQKECF